MQQFHQQQEKATPTFSPHVGQIHLPRTTATPDSATTPSSSSASVTAGAPRPPSAPATIATTSIPIHPKGEETDVVEMETFPAARPDGKPADLHHTGSYVQLEL